MSAYRIYFDGGTPPILREAETERDAEHQGLDYLENSQAAAFVGETDMELTEQVRCVERLVPERENNV